MHASFRSAAPLVAGDMVYVVAEALLRFCVDVGDVVCSVVGVQDDSRPMLNLSKTRGA